VASSDRSKKTVQIDLGVLSEVAADFGRASQETQQLASRLEEGIGRLESTWTGIEQQIFYLYYREWQQQMGGFSQILGAIASELAAVAEKYDAGNR